MCFSLYHALSYSLKESTVTFLSASEVDFWTGLDVNVNGNIAVSGFSGSTEYADVKIYKETCTGCTLTLQGATVDNTTESTSHFGGSVSINKAGDMLAIGGVYQDENDMNAPSQQGLFKIMTKLGSEWFVTNVVSGSNSARFGMNAAVHPTEDRVAVGEPIDDKVFLYSSYDSDKIIWSLSESKEETDASDFGTNLKYTSNQLLVSSIKEDRIYAFDKDNGFTLEQTIKPLDTVIDGFFGLEFSVTDTHLAVLQRKYLYIFKFNTVTSQWSIEQTLYSNDQTIESFTKLFIRNDILIVKHGSNMIDIWKYDNINTWSRIIQNAKPLTDFYEIFAVSTSPKNDYVIYFTSNFLDGGALHSYKIDGLYVPEDTSSNTVQIVLISVFSVLFVISAAYIIYNDEDKEYYYEDGSEIEPTV